MQLCKLGLKLKIYNQLIINKMHRPHNVLLKNFLSIKKFYLTILILNLWIPETIAYPVSSAEKEPVSVLFPQTQLYPHYIANPLRPTFSLQNMRYAKTDIIGTSLRRYDLKVGGHLGVYRSQPESTQRGWQVTLGAGFHGEFDPASSEDNVGWDGIMAISVEIRQNKFFAHRLGVHHISSHVGDELIESTGIKRINYTRQEIRYGVMWLISPTLQSYLEAGKAYDLRNKLIQKDWRTEFGIQYENKKYWRPDLGWYAAADFSQYEENNNTTNTSLHFGIITSINNRNYRLGFELYEGRSPMGEFFQSDEKYIGFGFWVDI